LIWLNLRHTVAGPRQLTRIKARAAPLRYIFTLREGVEEADRDQESADAIIARKGREAEASKP
jgi:hypothetical protein